MEIVSVEVSEFCDRMSQVVTNSVSGAREINFPLAIIFSFDELKNWQIIPLSFVISDVERIKYMISIKFRFYQISLYVAKLVTFNL